MELFASHCVFPTPDIRKTAEYYQQKLGFRRVDLFRDQRGIGMAKTRSVVSPWILRVHNPLRLGYASAPPLALSRGGKRLCNRGEIPKNRKEHRR